MLNKTKRILKQLLDIVEIYIPTVTFLTLFVVFILQVYHRYILRDPLMWGIELTEIAFVWTIMLGASYARRKRDHVAFSLIYDVLPQKGQLYMRLIANATIVISFGIALNPVFQQIALMTNDTSSVLRIPFTIIYLPFLFLIISFIGYSLYDIVTDIKKLLDKDNRDFSENVFHDQFDEEELEVPEMLKE